VPEETPFAKLMRRVRAGDQDAAAELFREYEPSVRRVVRLRREAEAVARLQHPYIVQVFEVGEHKGVPFIALEFCAAARWTRSCVRALPPRFSETQSRVIAEQAEGESERALAAETAAREEAERSRRAEASQRRSCGSRPAGDTRRGNWPGSTSTSIAFRLPRHGGTMIVARADRLLKDCPRACASGNGTRETPVPFHLLSLRAIPTRSTAWPTAPTGSTSRPPRSTRR
jgi:hypothetical protein